ncbi:carbohydrate ABC transporter permease [Thermosipho ferrireducens]|uniref:Carbohydrate ABC transporter permease n=1 Tax=Thermosipho ferrireducens TaxID=2571116 RepID=A0ABX7S819_9BACT|nr:carbohydrate ABC transporter permease [Thermosipho ferrireducens]QTA38737.1 carbohydrate ABC transporter permease [Thermosipho ferrireducens]
MKKVLFLTIMFALLLVSLFPMIAMFYTAVIPSGNLTRVIKERYINDFETKYMIYLRRKVKSGGKISIVKESPESTKSILVERDVTLLADKLDMRVAKYVEFWVKGKGSFSVEILDAFGKSTVKTFSGNDEWRKYRIKYNEMKYINLKYVSKIIFRFDGKHYLDDVKLVYKFPAFLNFISVLKEDMFGRYIFNSFLVSSVVVLGNMIFSTMVAYAFARREFFGKNILFSIVLMTMMIPPQITIIPIFILMKKIGWIDTYFALTVPLLVTPFSIFLLKQYIEQLPVELEQAAYVDGANTFQILFKIVFPLTKPALAVMGINTFIAVWNDLFYPLVMTNSREMRTVQVGLALYQKLNQVDWPRLMAASSIIGIPVIIVFLVFQKHIISGITKGALKG